MGILLKIHAKSMEVVSRQDEGRGLEVDAATFGFELK